MNTDKNGLQGCEALPLFLKKELKYYWPNEVGNFAATTIPEGLVFIIKENMKL